MLFNERKGCLCRIELHQGSDGAFFENDIKWLGICEILAGLLALIIPAQGLILGAIGFGLLHIVYGGIMNFK